MEAFVTVPVANCTNIIIISYMRNVYLVVLKELDQLWQQLSSLFTNFVAFARVHPF